MQSQILIILSSDPSPQREAKYLPLKEKHIIGSLSLFAKLFLYFHYQNKYKQNGEEHIMSNNF